MGIEDLHSERSIQKSQISRRFNSDKDYFYSLVDVLYQTLINAYEDASTVREIDALEDDVSAMIMDYGRVE